MGSQGWFPPANSLHTHPRQKGSRDKEVWGGRPSSTNKLCDEEARWDAADREASAAVVGLSGVIPWEDASSGCTRALDATVNAATIRACPGEVSGACAGHVWSLGARLTYSRGVSVSRAGVRGGCLPKGVPHFLGPCWCLAHVFLSSGGPHICNSPRFESSRTQFMPAGTIEFQ